MILTGDCVELMRTLEANSVDAVVTDPPYGLEFMGKEWDAIGGRGGNPFDAGGKGFRKGSSARFANSPALPTTGERKAIPKCRKCGKWKYNGWKPRQCSCDEPDFEERSSIAYPQRMQAWHEAWGTEALRVTKPGGYLLAFGGTRTHHRLVCGLEDAGWIIRDELDWIYACLSDDTEILTGRGWLHYNEVSTNDTALAFDSATGQLQWEPIEAVHKYHHEGDMVRLVGDGTDQLVTLNHRLVLVDGPGVAQVPGVRQRVLAALRSFAPIQRSRMLDSMQRDTPLARSSVPNRETVGVDRGRQGVVSTEDERPQEPGMEGRRYRFPQAWELFGSPLHPSAWLELADGSQGRVHHGAPATDGGSVRLPDDQGRGGQSREPRPDRQSARELDALALEPRSQAVRVVEAGDAWSLVPSGPVWASEVGYAGVVWCVTVPSGAFVARRRGLAFVTGNSGFPKGKANLKPAHEPIVLARKPGPLQALNIEETRIDSGPKFAENAPSRKKSYPAQSGFVKEARFGGAGVGRWPSNVLLSDPELFDQPNPWVVGSGATSESASGVQKYQRAGTSGWKESQGMFTEGREWEAEGYGDSGGYSRFFIIPKADRADREPVLRGQLAAQEVQTHGAREQGPLPQQTPQGPIRRENSHSTVKPTDLMRHLVRLVTPPRNLEGEAGLVLDPFLGSGTTAIACELEGFRWIGIEKEPEYVAIAEARLNGTQRGLGLDTPLVSTRKASVPFEDRSEKARQQIIDGHTPQRYQLWKEQDGRRPTDEEPAA